ncbi:MAG TPA: tRNA-uridine aminocarboxypropyltransferase [Aliidongia sp.]|nr:tRNA-uridine aminocarboxypropyltransferase [Aliidongia sp.]
MSDASEICPDCQKPSALCVCAGIEPFANKVELVILQHPQEQDRELGTARLAIRHFRTARLAIGLSWPNLAKLVGRPVQPQRWGVLYLGPAHLSAEATEREILVLDRKGVPLPEQDRILGELEGVILLDGSWSQAKALWWRNPWLLKTRRIVLNPRRPSRYGRLRKEPRRDSVSTLEAAAMILARLEGKPEIEARMVASFERMLDRYRETQKQPIREP